MTMPTTARTTARVMPRIAGIVSPCWPLLARVDPSPDMGDESLAEEFVEDADVGAVVRLVTGAPSIMYETDCVGSGPPTADMIPF